LLESLSSCFVTLENIFENYSERDSSLAVCCNASVMAAFALSWPRVFSGIDRRWQTGGPYQYGRGCVFDMPLEPARRSVSNKPKITSAQTKGKDHDKAN
jgi:hypothetical protein